jgi:hypothetical protein
VVRRWGSNCKRKEITLLISFHIPEFIKISSSHMMMIGAGATSIRQIVFKLQAFEKMAGNVIIVRLSPYLR